MPQTPPSSGSENKFNDEFQHITNQLLQQTKLLALANVLNDALALLTPAQRLDLQKRVANTADRIEKSPRKEQANTAMPAPEELLVNELRHISESLLKENSAT